MFQFLQSVLSPDRKATGIWDMAQADTLKEGMKEGRLQKSDDCSGRQSLLVKVPRIYLSFSCVSTQEKVFLRIYNVQFWDAMKMKTSITDSEIL